ncbi:MAG: hypothetical protein E7467_09110 [Ruminococcaceae bacterium]|nr:hypothetical protein [Oscillospiraceae bacterium]
MKKRSLVPSLDIDGCTIPFGTMRGAVMALALLLLTQDVVKKQNIRTIMKKVKIFLDFLPLLRL